METIQRVRIKSIHRRVSAIKNVYHEISIQEKVTPEINVNEPFVRMWNKLYYPNDMATNRKEDLIEKEVEIVLVFYPVKKQIGDIEFTNIECHIKDIKDT